MWNPSVAQSPESFEHLRTEVPMIGDFDHPRSEIFGCYATEKRCARVRPHVLKDINEDHRRSQVINEIHGNACLLQSFTWFHHVLPKFLLCKVSGREKHGMRLVLRCLNGDTAELDVEPEQTITRLHDDVQALTLKPFGFRSTWNLLRSLFHLLLTFFESV